MSDFHTSPESVVNSKGTATNEDADKPSSFGIDIEAGDYFREASKRIDRTNELIRQHEELKENEVSGFSETITSLLEKFLSLGKLDGLTIASEDGLIIAETHNLKNAEIMVAIGSMFEYAAQRAQSTGIVRVVDEMTVYGLDGELAVVRYFPNLKRRFFLMAYAKKHCSYRRITNLALKQCGTLLEQKFEKT
ncbi:MAG: hypothetical protein GXP30_13745 [Verrucomicrobia bacterium]|nr:hypothetical protein [Verrucomicrobiota bacterium]